jgi:hypothetical protein
MSKELTHMTLSNRENLGSFSEENRKLSQELNGHPGIEKTHIQIGATEDHDLVLTGKKPTLVRGGHRGTV